MRQFLTVAAGLSGAAAVAAGAIGSHALGSGPGSEAWREVWKTGTHYHLVHSVALALVALNATGRKQRIAGLCFLGGVVLFSGSCYVIALTGQRRPYSVATPIGGLMYIAGWLAFAFL